MVSAAGHITHHSLHFQLEQKGRGLSDGYARLHGDEIELQIATLLKKTDDTLLFGG